MHKRKSKLHDGKTEIVRGVNWSVGVDDFGNSVMDCQSYSCVFCEEFGNHTLMNL